jgi:hypothetical protein
MEVSFPKTYEAGARRFGAMSGLRSSDYAYADEIPAAVRNEGKRRATANYRWFQ